jgi:hypothetical protein
MSTPAQRSMQDWTPAEHIAVACDLLEAQSRESGRGTIYTITPISLTRARLHVDIAQAKMTGRMRA